ncbi:IclR family transcriptional regulator [Microbacterium aurantiacum]|uniref:IclR family transcriptional regulator n=1 Tax=Microbacterium aurantiacum TaxID=162393 RepID=UPI003D755F0D
MSEDQSSEPSAVAEGSGANGTAQRTKGVDSARRALQILLQFTESTPELTLENVLDAHGISVPSAYRYISLLREMDLIEEREKGRFVLSPQVLKLAHAAEATFDYQALAQPFLDRLAEQTGESALYLRRVNDSAVCIAIAESDHPISISFRPGQPLPLHSGAAAKLLLSALSPSKLNQYLQRVGPTMSKQARKRLESDLDAIRDSGYAESAGEVDQGVWASAAAIRSQGSVVGAVTVVAPAYRLDEAHRAQIIESVRGVANELQRAFNSRALE